MLPYDAVKYQYEGRKLKFKMIGFHTLDIEMDLYTIYTNVDDNRIMKEINAIFFQIYFILRNNTQKI